MMKLMVRSTGTLVKRDSTSSDAMCPLVSLVFRISRKSEADVRLYLAGTYGVRSAPNFFARWYVGVGIWEIIGLSLFPGL